MGLFRPEERQAVAERLLELLRADGRVAEAMLAGSLAAGTADEYSDLDLTIVARPDVDLSALADEWVERLRGELPVLGTFEVWFGRPVRGLLLDNLLEIDLDFTREAVPNEDEGDPAEREAGLAWHDILHAAVALRRRLARSTSTRSVAQPARSRAPSSPSSGSCARSSPTGSSRR